MHDAEWVAVVLGGVVIFMAGVMAGWWLLKWELRKQGYRLRWQRETEHTPKQPGEGVPHA